MRASDSGWRRGKGRPYVEKRQETGKALELAVAPAYNTGKVRGGRACCSLLLSFRRKWLMGFKDKVLGVLVLADMRPGVMDTVVQIMEPLRNITGRGLASGMRM